MADRIHITTAIFYSNGTPHVGSAYEALAADVFARSQRRRRGRENVSFLSGTDEHGDKIRRAAIAEGLAPKAYTDKMSVLFRDAFKGLNVDLDYWVRTTDEVHEKFVQQMLVQTHARGNIEFKEYEGLYCVGCERFYTEKELQQPGNICPTHSTPVELIKESNYFLKIDQFRTEMIEKIKRDEILIRPERYKNEALNMLGEPLSDLCISRPKARMDWGIELPFDDKYVTYVWYDAFWAYVSEPASRLGLDNFMRDWWPDAQHFIGKDILKTHAVYWPAILLAAGLPLFKTLNVHGWLNFGGSRMSKSSGNVRDPVTYERAFGPDVLRYFVMREVVYGLDGDFSEERLTDRYNADLANDLGNVVSRVLSMAARYFNGEISTVAKLAKDAGATDLIGSCEHKLYSCFGEDGKALEHRVAAAVDDLDFKGALEGIWQTIDAANKYIVATAPFSLAKDPANLPQVAQILANLLETIRVVADALEPFMPITAEKIFDLLNIDDATARKPYGEGLKPGHKVKASVALFPRREKLAAS
jgi:methionyl-tRNA synthetase